jgi:outer membrane murein-binding lipoprotein Lpp
MQRYAIETKGKWAAVPVDAGAFYKVTDVAAHVDELNAELEMLKDQLDTSRHNASAFENEMGNLQVENGKIREAYKGYSSKLLVDALTHERDTLRDVLALLAPDLKAMAILYAQKGDHARSQALANICKSVGVL